jgi:hypothetical protein
MAVSYVLLPSTRLDQNGGPIERALLLSGATGLTVVYRSAGWTIYAVPHPSGIIQGPAPAQLTHFGHRTISGVANGAGEYLLRVRYTPYWDLSSTVQCVRSRHDGMTDLFLARPGRFTLTIPDDLEQLLATPGFAALVGQGPAHGSCPTG